MTNDVPLGVICAALFAEAKSYIDASEVLINASQHGLPTYFLLSHGLELVLKSYLVAQGMGLEELRDEIGHDLQKAHDRACLFGLRVDHAHAPLIGVMSEFHKKMIFRYPVVNRDGDLVVPRTLFEAPTVLQIVQTIAGLVEGKVVMARIRAAGSGPYPIEEWHMG